MAKEGGKGLKLASLVTELGFIIALPLLAGVIAGQWLDRLIGTKVVFTLIGMALALFISSYAIYRKIKQVTNNN